jgi:hypothetical protein
MRNDADFQQELMLFYIRNIFVDGSKILAAF